jgi:hypothetical protein
VIRQNPVSNLSTQLALQKIGLESPRLSKPDSYPHFTNGFCEMAYQAKSYGRVYHNLYHLVPLYKRAKKDVGKNQLSKRGMKSPRPQAHLPLEPGAKRRGV